MIDRDARNLAISFLIEIRDKRLLTNWKLEDNWPSSISDPAINCILHWLWTLYDDFLEVSLIEILSKQDLQIIDRCYVFLSSDIEFRVQKLKKISFWEKIKIKIQWGSEWRLDCILPTYTDNDFWPFPDQEAYDNIFSIKEGVEIK
ncbi:MAG: hypothetical protein QM487_01030, partial [Candidatus Marithrix sp.]